jgi:formylmethanofuran dehydrogenase subunit E
MSPENDAKLCERYPMLYADRHAGVRQSLMSFGFECGDGWFDIIDQMSAELEQLNRDLAGEKIVADQIKEKWAVLRVYISAPSSVFDVAARIVRRAEQRSAAICEQCGAKGYVHDARGWVKTLCDKCHEERENGE